MLQQTGAEVVAGRFDAFLKRFPTYDALAAASEDDVVSAWAGLGYYRRARLLRLGAAAARARGGVPSTFAELRELPGVGRYTAGAIASMAFGERVAAIDGNVARVLSRVFKREVDVSTDRGRAALEADALAWMPRTDPGRFNEALIELGATVCKPKAPLCDACPLGAACDARASGEPTAYPKKAARAATTAVVSARALIVRSDAAWLVRRPDDATLLPGFEEFPGRRAAPGEDAVDALRDALTALGAKGATIGRRVASVPHAITRYRLTCELYEARAPKSFRPPCGRFAPFADVFGPKTTTETRKLATSAGLRREATA
jgi:A/G-specific adenine glycosylase